MLFYLYYFYSLLVSYKVHVLLFSFKPYFPMFLHELKKYTFNEIHKYSFVQLYHKC